MSWFSGKKTYAGRAAAEGAPKGQACQCRSNCPAGRQPTDDLDADCARVDSRGDFCCVPAPASTASMSDAMIDCFPDADCELCWSPVEDPTLTCADGRVACAYACLD